jgi:hypothetical protein
MTATLSPPSWSTILLERLARRRRIHVLILTQKREAGLVLDGLVAAGLVEVFDGYAQLTARGRRHVEALRDEATVREDSGTITSSGDFVHLDGRQADPARALLFLVGLPAVGVLALVAAWALTWGSS